MNVEAYLIIGAGKHGLYYQATGLRVTRKRPDTKSNEIAIRLDLEIPDMLFQKPQLQAKFAIPEDSVSQPVISAAVMDNIAETLSQQLGIKVHVTADIQEAGNC
jgi:hypothetical protein